MFQFHRKHCAVAIFLLLLFPTISNHAIAQVVPDQPAPVAQPGQMGYPFPSDRSWNHVALEFSGGYAPVVSKGAGYFNKGFNVTVGVVDHIGPRWTVMAEVQIFGLRGSSASSNGSGALTADYSSTVVSIGAAGAYDFLPRARTSPYVIGGAGYYLLGGVTLSGPAGSDLTAIDSASAVGYNGGAGIRHRLFSDKHMELFAEGRYHYIASGSSAFGQISLLPVSAGIRW